MARRTYDAHEQYDKIITKARDVFKQLDTIEGVTLFFDVPEDIVASIYAQLAQESQTFGDLFKRKVPLFQEWDKKNNMTQITSTFAVSLFYRDDTTDVVFDSLDGITWSLKDAFDELNFYGDGIGKPLGVDNFASKYSISNEWSAEQLAQYITHCIDTLGDGAINLYANSNTLVQLAIMNKLFTPSLSTIIDFPRWLNDELHKDFHPETTTQITLDVLPVSPIIVIENEWMADIQDKKTFMAIGDLAKTFEYSLSTTARMYVKGYIETDSSNDGLPQEQQIALELMLRWGQTPIEGTHIICYSLL